MLKSVVVAVLAAANIAQADILESRAAGDIAQTATFDEVDIPRPNTLGAQVGTLLGNYLLNFTNIYLLAPGRGGGNVPVGIRPSSGFNVGAYAQGGKTPSYITIPRSSTVTSFDLRSFNFGCVVGGGNGGATGATGCTIGIVGFRGNSRVANQVIRFTPTTPRVSNTIRAVLSTDFRGLTAILLATTYSAGLQSGGATYLDDVRYIVHTGAATTTSSTTTSSTTTSTSTSTNTTTTTSPTTTFPTSIRTTTIVTVVSGVTFNVTVAVPKTTITSNGPFTPTAATTVLITSTDTLGSTVIATVPVTADPTVIINGRRK